MLLALCACSPEVTTGGSASTADAGSNDAVVLPDGAVVKGLKLSAVTPNQGNVAGGDQLDIAGVGFLPNSRVFLGTEEATVSWRAGTTHIYVVAPASKQPGTVDVRVENSKTAKSSLNRAYSYLSIVTVESFAPDQGSMVGGAEITV